MATQTERERLRQDIGLSATDTTTMPDAEADAIYTEAGESHTDGASLYAATRVIAIRRLLASSAKLTTYQQNNSMEKLSDVFAHLKVLLDYWTGELSAAVGATYSGSVRFGRPTRKPARIKEHPNTGWEPGW